MDHDLKSLTRDVLDLPLEDRLKLLDAVLSSLDGADGDILKAWGREAESRLDAYAAGELQSRDASEVLARHLKL